MSSSVPPEDSGERRPPGIYGDTVVLAGQYVSPEPASSSSASSEVPAVVDKSVTQLLQTFNLEPNTKMESAVPVAVSNQQCLLARLPRKIRFGIYALHFKSGSPQVWFHAPGHQECQNFPCETTPCPGRRRLLFKDGTSPLMLILTCKAIKEEALPVLWKFVSFHFFDTTPMLRMMLSKSEKMLSKVTSLDIVQTGLVNMNLMKLMDLIKKFKRKWQPASLSTALIIFQTSRSCVLRSQRGAFGTTMGG